MEVPIKFESNGKQYHGHFKPVSGAASANTWNLMIDNYYHGQFIYTQNNGWRFTSQSGEFQELTDFFEFYLISFFA